MQLAVSFDRDGNITLMFEPSKLQGNEGTIGYQPAPRENHHVLDLPKQLEGKQLPELARILRVNTRGATPTLEVKPVGAKKRSTAK